MEYSVGQASNEIGKRVIVSVRILMPNNEEQVAGYWGIIDSVDDDGFLVKIEGGIDEEFQRIPPDFNFLQKARDSVYQFGANEVIRDVDYEVYMDISNENSTREVTLH